MLLPESNRIHPHSRTLFIFNILEGKTPKSQSVAAVDQQLLCQIKTIPTAGGHRGPFESHSSSDFGH